MGSPEPQGIMFAMRPLPTPEFWYIGVVKKEIFMWFHARDLPAGQSVPEGCPYITRADSPDKPLAYFSPEKPPEGYCSFDLSQGVPYKIWFPNGAKCSVNSPLPETALKSVSVQEVREGD